MTRAEWGILKQLEKRMARSEVFIPKMARSEVFIPKMEG